MADQLTEEQISEVREAFVMFDRDNSGHISTNDLDAVMRCLGRDQSTSELQDMINEVDCDGTGIVEFPEFLDLLARRCCGPMEESLSDAFKIFDLDSSGYVSLPDFCYVIVNHFKNIGEKLSNNEVAQLIAEVAEHGLIEGREELTREMLERWVREELARQAERMQESSGLVSEEVLGAKQISLTVNDLSGDTVVSITLDSAATVEMLRQHMKERVGVSVEQQSLVFAGVALEPHSRLAEVGVTDGSVVTLIVGMQMKVRYDNFLSSMMSK